MSGSNALLRWDEQTTAGWGPIELFDHRDSLVRFWTLVLQFAIADGADSVHYRLDRGDDCLGIEIGGIIHYLDPPPIEYRQSLLYAARKLVAGKWMTAVRRYFNGLLGPLALGQIQVEIPGGVTEWVVSSLQNGVLFARRADLATSIRPLITQP